MSRSGVEPGPDLRRLHEAILRQDASLELPATRPSSRRSSTHARRWSGREAELDWLREHWRELAAAPAARAGGGRARDRQDATGGRTGRRGAARPRGACSTLGRRRTGAARAVLAWRQRRGDRRCWCSTTSTAPTDELRAALARLAEGGRRCRCCRRDGRGRRRAPELRSATTLTPRAAGRRRRRRVARLYARGDAEVPVERCWRGERRCPAARAPRRARVGAHGGRAAVGAAADRAPASGRRCARPRTTSSATWSSSRRRGERAAPHGESRRLVVCPFKGLASFDVEDARVFFGRERLVAEMVARLAGAPLMGIVGPSGSGKSSALRAGLLAALAAGVLPGSESWAVALMRPGEHPLRALEHAPPPQRRAPAGPRGRSVRGGLHGLPRRGASARRSSTRSSPRARPAPARARARRRAGRLLRPLRRLPGAGAAARRQPRPRRTDAARRAASRDRAARAPRRPAGRA